MAGFFPQGRAGPGTRPARRPLGVRGPGFGEPLCRVARKGAVMSLEVQFLPARQGDAIWVRWGRGRQLMIDMGTEQTGRKLAKRFEALPESKRRFDLLVITHVDSDHI